MQLVSNMFRATVECNREKLDTVLVSHEHKCRRTHPSHTHTHTHTHTQTHKHTNTHRHYDKHKLDQVHGTQGNVATEKKTASVILVASDTQKISDTFQKEGFIPGHKYFN